MTKRPGIVITAAQSQTSHLCLRCTTIIEEALLEETEQQFGHHHSLRSFKKAINEGCYLCILLWSRIQNFEPRLRATGNVPDLEITYTTSLASLKSSGIEAGREKFDIDFSINWEKGYNAAPILEYCTVLSADIAKKYLASFTMPNTNSKRLYIEQARKWLSTCLSSHKSCSKVRTEELPTRLVAVKKMENQLRARLCDSTGLPPRTDYLTLSHIWGKSPIATLKKDNIEQLKKSIPIKDLPQVFQDAMFITNELGYSFLWIDCLCIIQDSDGGVDWLRECPRMNQVYGNSICNLAATGFESSQEGLFPTLHTENVLLPMFDCHTLNKENPHSSYYVVSPSEWAVEVNQAPLHCRGWVLQEQIMAPRIVHFTKKQLYWECHAAKACEVFPIQFPPYGTSEQSLKNKIQVLSTLNQGLSKKSLYRQWYNLVAEYSRADLTFAEDKLPAISGLAKAFFNRLHDDYLAGLWRNDLLRGILWHGMENTTAATKYRAPSWSWASFDGLVVCAEREITMYHWEPLAHILSAETVPLTAGDVTGQLVDGFIRISGPLREVTIGGNLEKYNSRFNFKSPIILGRQDSTTRQAVLYSCRDRDLAGLSIYPSVHDWLPSKKIFLMPLLVRREDNPICLVHGIVLTPKGAHGKYTKVGSFFTGKEENLQCLFFQDHSIDEFHYEEYDGEHRCTVRIV